MSTITKQMIASRQPSFQTEHKEVSLKFTRNERVLGADQMQNRNNILVTGHRGLRGKYDAEHH
ncbi:hypothetical protein [Roseibium sp.]|uniref:hypothetical protein n=1 Tax=Roseibium sp. TaxID=1936156 RepID=UPI00260B867C|nr:hypothetical protein [Roseibium sp.]